MVYNFFFTYVGGKQKDIKHIQPFVDMSDITTICEPFCGSCAFSLHQKDIKKFIFNDIDINLMNFLKEVQHGQLQQYINYFNEKRPTYQNGEKPTSEWYTLRKRRDLNIHEWFFVRRASRGGSMMDLRLQTLKEGIFDKLELFFMNPNITLKCEDYTKIFNDVKDNKKCFVFLDPPYLDSFNASYESFKGDSTSTDKIILDRTKMFIDILEFLKVAKCRVMLIINKNSLTCYIYKDFIKGEYDKRYDLTGRCTKHLIVTNY